MIIKTQDIINFNCDYIDIFGDFKGAKAMFTGMDFDNSCVREFLGFTIHKTEVPNYQSKIVFVKNNYPVFAYYTGKKLNNDIHSKNHFVVYGTAFLFFDLFYILDFIKNNINYTKLRRLDLCIDLLHSLDVLVKEVKTLVFDNGTIKFKQKGSLFTDGNGKLQTLYIGDKKATNNKTLLIRFYDKLADIKNNGKQKIYPDYLKNDFVTRLELEFRTDLCKNIDFDLLYNPDFLKLLFTSYITKHTDMFDYAGFKKLSLFTYKKREEVVDNLTGLQIFDSRFLSVFRGYARKLYENGICPVSELINSDLYKIKTISNIVNSSKGDSFNLAQFVINRLD